MKQEVNDKNRKAVDKKESEKMGNISNRNSIRLHYYSKIKFSNVIKFTLENLYKIMEDFNDSIFTILFIRNLMKCGF